MYTINLYKKILRSRAHKPGSNATSSGRSRCDGRPDVDEATKADLATHGWSLVHFAPSPAVAAADSGAPVTWRLADVAAAFNNDATHAATELWLCHQTSQHVTGAVGCCRRIIWMINEYVTLRNRITSGIEPGEEIPQDYWKRLPSSSGRER